MKINELIENLLKGHARYAKWRVLQELANILGASLGVGQGMLEKVCNGNASLHADTKQAFMGNWSIKEKEVLVFLNSLIQDEGIVATALGIPKADEYKKDLLCKAIRMQFEAFFSSEAIDKDNIIPDAYQQLLENPSFSPIVCVAFYPGDAAHDFSKNKYYQMDIYGILQHEIELQNRGKITWVNRRLAFINENQMVRPTTMDIPIPETRTNGIVKFTIKLYGRGGEGRSNLRWRMLDADGNDCFPQEPDKFHLEIETIYTPSN